MHIVVAGNIGSGKTTLTNMLVKHYGWKPQMETVEENPYLADYYKDIARWSFCLEVFFLKQRFRDLLRLPNRRTQSFRTALSLRVSISLLPITRRWATWATATLPHIWNCSSQWWALYTYPTWWYTWGHRCHISSETFRKEGATTSNPSNWSILPTWTNGMKISSIISHFFSDCRQQIYNSDFYFWWIK